MCYTYVCASIDLSKIHPLTYLAIIYVLVPFWLPWRNSMFKASYGKELILVCGSRGKKVHQGGEA